jgi:hypothetical protein
VDFDFWQRWGVALDDVSFANALLALGLLSQRREKRSLQDLQAAKWPGAEIPWFFPHPRIPVEGEPGEWAKAWVELHPRLDPASRLRVSEAPPDEPILPWYRMLSEARPAPRAVSISLGAPRAQLHIDWPLRLGAVSDGAWAFLESMQARRVWPSWKVSRMLRLGRDNANCDVLLHKGPPKELLQELLRLPFDVKANVVLMQGGAQSDWAELRALLVSVLAETRASGFVLLPASVQDDASLLQFLNEFVAETTHAQPVDVAFAAAGGNLKGREDILAGFTPEIAAFVLPQLVERFNARLAAMPPRTEVDLSGRRVAAASVRMRAEELMFDHEAQGGASMAELSEAMATAAVPPEAAMQRAARFLQQKSFVRPENEFREAKEGFLAGVPAMVRVRIGLPEEGWDAAPGRFPEEKLPPHLERWTLTVWLTEPDHLPAPLKRSIRLPRDGNSTECEFHFKPRELPGFEGRLTVLHRGRVIQTAVLRAAVLSAKHPGARDGAPKLEDPIVLRHRLGELDTRREFDLALVANHDAKGRPLLTAVSSKAAWVKDLSRMPAIAAQINNTLSPVAKSVQDYAKGLDGKKGEALLVQLAQHGGFLKAFLDEALTDPANNPASAAAEFIQIVSTRSDAVVPLEFVYDYTVPEDGAKVCEGWRKSLKDGKCPGTCDHSSGTKVCPMGFWGVRKVIERHAVTPGLAKDGNVLYLQSEASRAGDTLYLGGVPVLGSSARVPKQSIAELKKVIARHCGAKPEVAKDWSEWEKLVTTLHPALLVALPHTDGKSTNVTVEIGDKTVKTITLRQTHVFPPPVEGHQAPLVALIGCDVAGTADDYGNHVMVFRDRGAGIVIGTIATVFGEHAAKVAAKLVEGMLPEGNAAPVRLGELMRKVRRDSLLAGLLMPLCLVAYGDADWILARKRPSDG